MLVLDFLDHGDTLLIVIVVHLAYGGHFLQKTSVSSSEYCPFAWQCQASYTQLDLQLCMAVHLIVYGSVQVLHPVFYLSLNSWEAPGWQVIAVDADVKQGITSWLWAPNSSVFTLEYKPWYHCGANAEMVVVTTLKSEVYHLLHMCHVLIKVTITFWHESVCYFIFWKFFVYTLQSDQVSS